MVHYRYDCIPSYRDADPFKCRTRSNLVRRHVRGVGREQRVIGSRHRYSGSGFPGPRERIAGVAAFDSDAQARGAGSAGSVRRLRVRIVAGRVDTHDQRNRGFRNRSDAGCLRPTASGDYSVALEATHD